MEKSPSRVSTPGSGPSSTVDSCVKSTKFLSPSELQFPHHEGTGLDCDDK